MIEAGSLTGSAFKLISARLASIALAQITFAATFMLNAP